MPLLHGTTLSSPEGQNWMCIKENDDDYVVETKSYRMIALDLPIRELSSLHEKGIIYDDGHLNNLLLLQSGKICLLDLDSCITELRGFDEHMLNREETDWLKLSLAIKEAVSGVILPRFYATQERIEANFSLLRSRLVGVFGKYLLEVLDALSDQITYRPETWKECMTRIFALLSCAATLPPPVLQEEIDDVQGTKMVVEELAEDHIEDLDSEELARERFAKRAIEEEWISEWSTNENFVKDAWVKTYRGVFDAAAALDCRDALKYLLDNRVGAKLPSQRAFMDSEPSHVSELVLDGDEEKYSKQKGKQEHPPIVRKIKVWMAVCHVMAHVGQINSAGRPKGAEPKRRKID
jgi:hypothetical protein